MGRKGKVRESLESMIRNGRFPTPDAHNGTRSVRKQIKAGRQVTLEDAVGVGRHLNPQFVLWMMGFPLRWLDIDPDCDERNSKA